MFDPNILHCNQQPQLTINKGNNKLPNSEQSYKGKVKSI
jgi:hypothetical protein